MQARGRGLAELLRQAYPTLTPEAMVAAVLTYLATQPPDAAVTENLSRIAERLDRFGRALCAAFPPR